MPHTTLRGLCVGRGSFACAGALRGDFVGLWAMVSFWGVDNSSGTPWAQDRGRHIEWEGGLIIGVLGSWKWSLQQRPFYDIHWLSIVVEESIQIY